MAVRLNLSCLLKSEGKQQTAKLHSMPCVIKSNGEANVSKYFEPIITRQTDDVLQASFRGYPVLGKEINLPENYTGVVLQETNRKLSEEIDRNVYAVEKFDKFTYWNWDVEPSGNDKIAMALEWLDVAEVLHSPVES